MIELQTTEKLKIAEIKTAEIETAEIEECLYASYIRQIVIHTI